MRALAIVHEADTGPGVFADALAASGWGLDTWLISAEPSPPADPVSYDAVISCGSAANADEQDRHAWLVSENAVLKRLLQGGVPLLGVCLGAQLVAQAAGGVVRRAAQPEIGWYEVTALAPAAGDPLIGPLGARFDALQWHSYEFRLPEAATALARSAACLQAYRIGSVTWGIQFHAEVTLSDYEAWISSHSGDPGLDAAGERLRTVTRERIAAWNELGRGLCGRFLEAAAHR